MNRMKSYDVPHKGLRNALSQLSLLAGKTDYTNPEQVEQLYLLGTDVFMLLTTHATDEDQITLAQLEKKIPGSSQHDKEEHEVIHQQQLKLETLLSDIYNGSASGNDVCVAGSEFYLSFSEFHSAYLAHMAEEERVTQMHLWECFTDVELAEQRKMIMRKNTPDTLLTWFKFVLPAQSHAERASLLTGFKMAAPTPFFNTAMESIRKVLSVSEFSGLEKEFVG